MNEEYDVYPTALAAAAFAIKSLEDSRIQAETNAAAGPDASTSMKTKSEDKPTKVVSKARTESRKFSEEVPDKRVLIGGETTNENLPKKVTAPAPSLIRGPTTADEQFNRITKVGSKNAGPKKDVSAAPIKKTPTFADNNLNRTASTTPANSFPKPASSFPKPANTFPKPDPKPTAFSPTEIRSSGSAIPGMGNTQADVWEKTEMTKIIERYEKLNETISDWEDKKKTKAKRKMDKIEAEVESKRAKAMQHYRTKMEIIDQIAGGARAQADQNRRKEEVQVKNKANRIRTTGKTPPTCFCF